MVRRTVLCGGSGWILAGISPGAEGRSRAWPRGYDGSRPAPEIAEAGVVRGWYGYTSGRHEVMSDRPLDSEVVSLLITVFASVEPAVRRTPLDLISGTATGRRRRVRLFGEEKDYRDGGGSPGTVGVYDARRDETLMLASALTGGSRRGERPDAGRFDVFVHELVHHVLRDWRGTLPAWFSEGFAEFMAIAHVRPGVYEFSSIEREVAGHIARYLLPDGGVFGLPRLADITNLSGPAWMRSNDPHREDNYAKYAAAFLLLEWLMRRRPGGLVALDRYLEGLREADARRDRERGQDPWGARENLAQIEAHLVEFWRRGGLRLRFDGS